MLDTHGAGGQEGGQSKEDPAIHLPGTAGFVWAASINQPNKWAKWKCPKCEIWVDPPKQVLCSYCLSEKDKCQECGGTDHHLGDCSHLKPISAWPCIVCGGKTEHFKIGGDVVCLQIMKDQKCDIKVAERIAAAEARMAGFGRIH